MSTTTLPRRDAPKSASHLTFPTADVWHSRAPRAVVESAWGANTAGWKAWRKHLAEREPRSLSDLIAGRRPLLWGVSLASIEPGSREFIEVVTRAARGSREANLQAAEQLEMWLRESRGSSHSTPTAWECVAWTHALPHLARVAPAELWWELLERLLEVAEGPAPPTKYDSPLAWHLTQVELPLTLAWLLPELAVSDRLGAAGWSRLSEDLRAGADESHLMAARNLPLVRPRLASWLRSLAVARELPHASQDEAAPSLMSVVLHALRLTCPTGRQVLSAPATADHVNDLFQAAIQEADNAECRIAASGMFPALQPKRGNGRLVASPPAAWHSEEAGCGLLRRNWLSEGEMLAVQYASRNVCSELICGREAFLSGEWNVRLLLDGKPLEQRSDWDHVCWVSDKDADYLELEARFTGGVRVQRQMLLAREDRLLYLADAVLGQTEGELEYRGLLSLAPEINVMKNDDTRDLGLQGRRRLIRAQPLALPEWRRDPRGGSLTQAAGGLALQQSRRCLRMYAPLLIDLDPRRAKQALTWRQLTIAEDRKLVSADVAVGYRVQIGKQQWLIYRALGERANRTLLGSNLVSEFMFARFTAEGEAEPLLEIE